MKEIISTENMEQILTRIDTLASKLGVTAEYLFGIYVKQAYIEFASYISYYVLYGVFVIGTIIWGKYCFKRFTSEDFDTDRNGRDIATLISFIIVCVGCVVWGSVSISFIRETLMCYFNPEYFAFNKILRTIR